MKKWLLLLLLAIFLSVSVSTMFPRDRFSMVEKRFQNDLPQLTQTAQTLLAGGEAGAPEGWNEADVFDNVVCFCYEGWGLGSSTGYWGVNYVPNDCPVGFQGTSIEGAVPEGDGWLWMETGGDNRCYVERLAPCWYYFEMTF